MNEKAWNKAGYALHVVGIIIVLAELLSGVRPALGIYLLYLGVFCFWRAEKSDRKAIMNRITFRQKLAASLDGASSVVLFSGGKPVPRTEAEMRRDAERRIEELEQKHDCD